MQKSWMWQNEHSGGVEGAIIDLEENRVQWLDAPGCACGSPSMEQTVDNFREKGSRFLSPPSDVLDEMRDFVATVSVND